MASEGTLLTDEGRVLRDAFRRYVVEGTPEKEHGPPWGPPWSVIDCAIAEPEVNWSGELLGQFDDAEEANNLRWSCVARDMLAALRGEDR